MFSTHILFKIFIISIFFSICDSNEFFEKFANILIESKIFFFATTTIHLSNSKTKISSIDSMSIFTIVLIFDKLHDICFEIDKNSLTTKISNNVEMNANHLRNSKTKISFIDSISLDFKIVILIFDKSHDICFKINEN